MPRSKNLKAAFQQQQYSEPFEEGQTSAKDSNKGSSKSSFKGLDSRERSAPGRHDTKPQWGPAPHMENFRFPHPHNKEQFLTKHRDIDIILEESGNEFDSASPVQYRDRARAVQNSQVEQYFEKVPFNKITSAPLVADADPSQMIQPMQGGLPVSIANRRSQAQNPINPSVRTSQQLDTGLMATQAPFISDNKHQNVLEWGKNPSHRGPET